MSINPKGIATDAFQRRVEQTHGASAMGVAYRYLIDMVVNHPDLALARERHAARERYAARARRNRQRADAGRV